MKKRLLKELKSLGILLLIGVLYYIFVSVTGFGIPCLFSLITGLKCPGCGVTRMCMAIARLDFASAFEYNPVVFVTLPVLAGCLLTEKIIYIKTGIHKMPVVCNVLLCIEAVILVIYGVIRNIG